MEVLQLHIPRLRNEAEGSGVADLLSYGVPAATPGCCSWVGYGCWWTFGLVLTGSWAGEKDVCCFGSPWV